MAWRGSALVSMIPEVYCSLDETTPDGSRDITQWRTPVKYKGYEGIVTFDDEAGLFHGEVINTRDVITFQGRSVDEIKKAFKESVDDYLAFCKKRKEKAEKPFSGKLVIRINPDLHRRLFTEAKKKHLSLNALVQERLAG